MKAIETNKQFNELALGDKPFVLDFYADWCGPCQQLLPIVEKLADEYKEDVEILKVNVDNQKELAAKFKIRGIPAVFFMKKNEIQDKVTGLVSETVLRNKIDALI